ILYERSFIYHEGGPEPHPAERRAVEGPASPRAVGRADLGAGQAGRGRGGVRCEQGLDPPRSARRRVSTDGPVPPTLRTLPGDRNGQAPGPLSPRSALRPACSTATPSDRPGEFGSFGRDAS